MNQCFKIKLGTKFAEAVEKHHQQLPHWKDVMRNLSDYLGEEITEMSVRTAELWVNPAQIESPENKKLFTESGKLKRNTKRANEVYKFYELVVSEYGLSDFLEMGHLLFCYGVMRMRGEKLESFSDGEKMMYFKADFDLCERSHGAVEPITEIEYEEQYLSLLKKQESV